jgi:hypothetical protein
VLVVEGRVRELVHQRRRLLIAADLAVDRDSLLVGRVGAVAPSGNATKVTAALRPQKAMWGVIAQPEDDLPFRTGFQRFRQRPRLAPRAHRVVRELLVRRRTRSSGVSATVVGRSSASLQRETGR